MGVRKCPKCGSVWYTALVNCAFCGIEGEEVKGPISPAKLNLAHGGVTQTPPESKEPLPPAPPPAPAAEPAPQPSEPKTASIAEVPKRSEAPEPTPAPPLIPEKSARVPQGVHAPERSAAPRMLPRIDAPTAPAPRIPSSIVPLVFGVLGLVACAIPPLLAALLRNRVAEILALLAFAILSPFAPFAWLAAQRYVDQCRLLGFAPASAAQSGKILGMLASFLLVFEISALSVFIVVEGLSGKLSCPLWKS